MTARTSSVALPKADDCLGLPGAIEAGSPLFYAIDFPELQYGQFAVCSMEISDGTPFLPDGQSYLDNEDGRGCWQVSDSFEEARRLAIANVVADPATESVIYNADGLLMHVIRNGQPVPLQTLLASRSKSKAWWQIWKES